MKMKKTDIGVVVVMYAVCAFFYAQTMQLKEESQTYPLFTNALLFGLTTLYLVQMIIAARRYGVESGKDEIFAGFQAKQFFVCLLSVFCYLALIYFLGFYISTCLFLAALLLFLKVPVKHTVIVLIALNLLIYLAFGRFLGVKLPTGILF